MVKPFDVSKFRKDITKSIDGLSIGFNDPTDWISTGNYCLNYLISGDFYKGVPLGKVTVLAGESGAGKTETVKILMAHLAMIASSDNSSHITRTQIGPRLSTAGVQARK